MTYLMFKLANLIIGEKKTFFNDERDKLVSYITESIQICDCKLMEKVNNIGIQVTLLT